MGFRVFVTESRFAGAIYEFNSLSFLPTAPGPKLI
jgi:hypothetical protein